ncbi:MAG: site-specific integrase [Bacteroidales bacterium]|nr:site-specific integrase [Bacteroidales bacterium]
MKVSIFIRNNYVNKNNECCINLRIFLNGKYFYLPLDIYCKPDDFNPLTQRVTKGIHRNLYNHIIKNALGSASNIFLRYKFQKRTLTREVFENEFKNPATITDFYAFMEDQIKKRRGEITDTSINQHLATLSKMKKFKPELLLVEIDENYIVEYQKFLKFKLKNKTSTINNSLKIIKVYVNKAIKLELISSSPFKYFKFKREKTYPEFLSENERDALIQLYQEQTLTKKHQNVLRWFLFGCFTGLRISDLRLAKHEDIANGILSIRPLKTLNVNNRRVDIPLCTFAKNLIKDENTLRLKGPLFQCISEQKMNKNIKEVASIAKIDKDISFHTARHTFASLFLKKSTKANGILILQQLLGHSNIETTMVYSHVLNEDVKEAMAEFDK